MASSAVNFALNKLGELATKEATLLLGLEDDIEYVKGKLEFFRAFLIDAEQKQRQTHYESVRVWVKQLREVAYDLEDVLDEFTVKIGLQRMGLLGWRASPWLHCCISPVMQLSTRHRLASQILKIKATLDRIATNKAEIPDLVCLSRSTEDSSSTNVRINNIRSEVDAEPTGQNKYVEKLMPQILNCDAQRHSIISICGMGGLGKTTLAKKLYNDKKVKYHFSLRAWLTISQTFNFVDLLRRLMKELHVEGDTSNADEMKEKLKDHLHKKRFIIVLDDMWDKNSWDNLITIFPEEHKGITVLLTTRDKNVATSVNPDDEPFEPQLLKPDESWQLFCRKALVGVNCPDDFQEFKEEVIKRSKGLPLAIIVLGGLLRKHKDPYQWRKVLDQPRCGKDEVESILCLSYDYLRNQLKACFLYVAGYPEDYEIDAQELTRMWIAEGFIQQEEDYTMEDLAEDYLEELIQMSLIQLVKRDVTGRDSIIRVHDLILDMARKEAQEISFLHRNTSQQNSTLVRRLSLCGEDGIHKHFNCVRNYSNFKLRSLRCIALKEEVFMEYFDLRSTKYLRVLSFHEIIFVDGKCLEAIGNLIQLKYLSFEDSSTSKKKLIELAKNISNLQNLQTLDISGTNVEQLPKKFWKIESLRHLIGGDNLKINQHVSEMKELQTMRGRPNYEWIREGGLQKLSNIRTLCMLGVFTHGSQNIDFGKQEEKLIEAIENLKHLTSLKLWFELASKKVLTVSNTTLRHLELWHGKIPSGEQHHNRQKSLPNLTSLWLVDMSLIQDDIYVIGLLPNLRSFKIENENKLNKLVFEEGCFSRLEELTLRDCFKLTSWEIKENWSKSAKKLQLLFLDNCPMLIILPHPQVLQLKEIRLVGNEWNFFSTRGALGAWVKQHSESPTNTQWQLGNRKMTV